MHETDESTPEDAEGNVIARLLIPRPTTDPRDPLVSLLCLCERLSDQISCCRHGLHGESTAHLQPFVSLYSCQITPYRPFSLSMEDLS